MRELHPTDETSQRLPLRLAFGVLFLFSLVPIWSVRYHPLPDLANHMAAMSAWIHLHDPAWDFQRYYALHLGLNPYWGYYAPMRLLSPLFGVEFANRCVLSAYVLLLPLGTAWLAVQLDRSAWLGLFAFPFLWTFSFTLGFIHTALGLALLPAAIAAFDWFCARPLLRRALVAIGLGVAVYFCHIMPFLIYVGCTGLIGLLHRARSPLRMLGRVIVWSAVLGCGIAVSLYGEGKGMGGHVAAHTFSWDTQPVWLILTQIYNWTWNNCTGHEDEIFAACLLVAWIGLRVTAKCIRPRSLHDFRALACVITAFVCYIYLPKSAIQPAYSWGIKYRAASCALLFLALLIPGAIVGWRRLWLIPVALVGIGFAVDTNRHWHTANQFTAGFDEATAAIPFGARALFIIDRPLADPAVRQDYAQSWPSFYQMQHGGYNPWLFEDFPLRFLVHLPAPKLRLMNFDWDTYAPAYDYVVTFHAATSGEMFGTHRGQVVQKKTVGPWTVWQLPDRNAREP